MEKEYTISFTDDKSPDWKILTLEIVDGGGSVMYEDVSVNRVNKKGETFPNFDNLKVGERVKGNLWTSSAGKKYLFAPDLNKPAGGANRGQSGGFKANMSAMVEKKQEGIRQSQENKELGIKTSSTARMACDIVVATLRGEEIIDESVLKGKLEMWRKWFWMHWDDPENYPPFE
jgi:hypothetical protein